MHLTETTLPGKPVDDTVAAIIAKREDQRRLSLRLRAIYNTSSVEKGVEISQKE